MKKRKREALHCKSGEGSCSGENEGERERDQFAVRQYVSCLWAAEQQRRELATAVRVASQF